MGTRGRRRALLVLSMAGLLLALSACATPSAVGSDPVASAPVSSATSTPGPVVLEQDVRPASILGGDCARVLDADVVAAAFGGATSPQPFTEETGAGGTYHSGVYQFGGFRCEISNGVGGEERIGLFGYVLPAWAVSTATEGEAMRACSAVENRGDGDHLPASDGCQLSFLSGGYWLNMYVRAPAATTPEDTETLLATLRADFAPHMETAGEPEPQAAAAPGTWAVPVDCAALAAAPEVVAALGTADKHIGDDFMHSDQLTSQIEAATASGYAPCWFGDGTSAPEPGELPDFIAEVMPGQGWRRDGVAASGDPYEIPGLDGEAFLGEFGLSVFHEGNWMQLHGLSGDADPAAFSEVAIALIAALDATALD